MTADPVKTLMTEGYCVLEGAVPTDTAAELEQRCRELHLDPANRSFLQDPNDDLYQTLFSLANLEEATWEFAAHPDVLATVRAVLETETRIGAICSKWVKPGSKAGGVHVDSTGDLPARLPEDPWLVNSMWMLSDFTESNGATLISPGSHLRRERPPRGFSPDDPMMKKITGSRGSVVLWHAGVWHANGANTSEDEHRMGLNIAYYPVWWNMYREGGHQPVWPEVFERMPDTMQELNRHRVGRTRAGLYERP